jgi:peptidoglycan hydrolase-like protein with peptidoglycan-binding domain
MLSVLSAYISEIPPLSVDGIFGQGTRAAVLAAQRRFRLPETGVVDAATWDEIYDQFAGIENTTLRSGETFPRSSEATAPAAAIRPVGNFRRPNGSNNSQRVNYARTTTLTQFPGRDLSMGGQDPIRQEVVR